MLVCRILVVDDNLFSRKLLTQHLETMGIAHVEQAARGESATDLLAEAYCKSASSRT